MDEFIKKIIKIILKIVVIVIVNICIINIAVISTNKGIGIDKREININILDDKIQCEDIINFNITKNGEIYYTFFKNSKYLEKVKIYINDKEVNNTIGLKNGKIHLDKTTVNDLKIMHGTKITIKIIYEINKDFIIRYSNTDKLYFYTGIDMVDYFKHLVINLNSNNEISNLNVEDAVINKKRK